MTTIIKPIIKGRLSLPVPVIAAFGAALLAIILEAVLFQGLVTQIRELADGVRKARLSDSRLSDVQDLLIQAEAGQRGYLLVGRDEYLKPYLRAVEQLSVAKEELRKSLSQTDADRADFARIDGLLQTKLSELDRSIELFRVAGQRQAIGLVASDSGKEASDAIRQIIEGRRASNEPAIERGRDAVYASMDRAKSITMVAGVLSAIVLAILAVIVVRHFASAHAKADLLEQTVEARAAQLAQLSRHLLSVRETERARIARELHDELGSCLTLLAQDLTQLRRLAAAGDPVAPEVVASMQQLLETSVRQQRQLIHSLRPPMIDTMGLKAALDALARQFSVNQGMPVEFSSDASLGGIDEDAAISLYRIVQESLTNIARHAHATRVEIKVATINDVLVLTIADNGRGATDRITPQGPAFGLTGMKERARYLGGSLTMSPGHAGRGTVVEALIPVVREKTLAET